MWSRHDGVIVYTPSKNHRDLPQQVQANSTNIGINELLNLQLKFFEDISGVNGALQGKPGYAGMSAALYNQQTQNATTSLLDLLDTFSEFVRDAAYKDVKNMQQFYDQKRVFNIAGRVGTQIEYDPRKSAMLSLTFQSCRVPRHLLIALWQTTSLCSCGNSKQSRWSNFYKPEISHSQTSCCSLSNRRKSSWKPDRCRRVYHLNL